MFSKIFSRIQLLRFIPHVIVYYTFEDKALLDYERNMYLSYYNGHQTGLRGFLLLLTINHAYRSLFYWRTNSDWLKWFAKGEQNLIFCTQPSKVGKGLMIWHGYSTVINAQSIGKNLQIWHNVTIGKKTTNELCDKPIIEDNVSICTGAVCIGDIKIGKNSIIGANATVVNDLPENSVAVNQPVRILKRKQ